MKDFKGDVSPLRKLGESFSLGKSSLLNQKMSNRNLLNRHESRSGYEGRSLDGGGSIRTNKVMNRTFGRTDKEHKMDHIVLSSEASNELLAMNENGYNVDDLARRVTL